MEFADVVRSRRMVRRFTKQPLPTDLVERILTSAVRAPSAGFPQGWAFLALTDESDRERFWPFVPNQTKHTPEVMNAPLVVVPLAHRAAYFNKYRRCRTRKTGPRPTGSSTPAWPR
jgi:nitroreductase